MPIAPPPARRHGRLRGCVAVLFGFLPRLCGMSSKFVDADNVPYCGPLAQGDQDALRGLVETMANLTLAMANIPKLERVAWEYLDAHSHVACPVRRNQQRRGPQSATSPKLSADEQCTLVCHVCWTSAQPGVDGARW